MTREHGFIGACAECDGAGQMPEAHDIEYRITTGTERAADGSALHPELVAGAIRTTARQLSAAFGGCTTTTGEGGWINPETGAYVAEQSATLAVCTDAPNAAVRVRIIAEGLRATLEQAAVLVAAVPITLTWVPAPARGTTRAA